MENDLNRIYLKSIEIKNMDYVEKITRIEKTRNGFKIFFKIKSKYANKNNLQYLNRIYEFDSLLPYKETEYADPNCIEFIYDEENNNG